MRRLAVVAVALAVCVPVLSHTQTPPTQGFPTFGAGVDVVQLDVSVSDKAGHPIRNLAVEDFDVRIDGRPSPVVSFEAVDLPAAPPASAPWLRELAPDVVTNDGRAGRVIVIVMDDASFGQAAGEETGQWAIEKMRGVARTVVANLSPTDLAAVVHTEDNHTAQDFTRDRARLLHAIDTAPVFPGQSTRGIPPPNPAEMNSSQYRLLLEEARLVNDQFGDLRGSCMCGVCSLDTLADVAESLRSLSGQRKTIFYLSVGLVVPLEIDDSGKPDGSCAIQKHEAMAKAFRAAALSNVTIEAIDPKGLVRGEMGGSPLHNPTTMRLEFLRTVAETTGGHVVVNTNAPEQHVPSILNDSRSYYLLGVRSPSPETDGRIHPIEITVDRPDVVVRTRRGYYAPTRREQERLAQAASRSNAAAAITGVLPAAGARLELDAVPLQGMDGRPTIAIVTAGQLDGPDRRTVEIELGAFRPETGDRVESLRQVVDVVPDATGRYEIALRLRIKPGVYQLRAGVAAEGQPAASVYADVDVPDFSKANLSLSGLILGSSTARTGPSEDGLPFPPTTRRIFSQDDNIGAYLRVYQEHASAPAPTLTALVVDERNQFATLRPATAAPRSTPQRGTGYLFPLPLRTLASGQYMLFVEAVAGDTRLTRAVRFTVAPR
jgi:VWFA-related protein